MPMKFIDCCINRELATFTSITQVLCEVGSRINSLPSNQKALVSIQILVWIPASITAFFSNGELFHGTGKLGVDVLYTCFALNCLTEALYSSDHRSVKESQLS